MTDGPVENTFVELRDVSRSYGGVTVLDAVSLSIGPGVTAVIGPNGSGKSTLLGIVAGAIDPVSGSVERSERRRERGSAARESVGTRSVGYLPQRVPFREAFTARETLGFYARLVGEEPEPFLEAVGLGDAADKRVEALSGGMRRLLGIAQATIGDPPVVVLDEPTSGLDPGMRRRAFAVAADRAGESDSDDAGRGDDGTGSTAVVVSSHDLDLVDEYADGVVLLRRGRVAAAGDRDALLETHGVADVTELYRTVIDGDPAADGRTDGDRGADDRSDRPDATSRSVHVTGVSER